MPDNPLIYSQKKQVNTFIGRDWTKTVAELLQRQQKGSEVGKILLGEAQRFRDRHEAA